MNDPESVLPLAEAEDSLTAPPPGSKLGMVLRGLDVGFALDELTARQGEGVQDKERPRRIIELRYGLTGQEPMTYGQIGAEIGISAGYTAKHAVRALMILHDVREEHKPEAVFPRRPIHGVDNAYLYSNHQLKKMDARRKMANILLFTRGLLHQYPEPEE